MDLIKTCFFTLSWLSAAIQLGSDEASKVKIPKAPERIAELIERGKVTFEFYDDTKIQRKFTGETKFDMKYLFRSSNTWKVTKNRLGKEHLEIRVRFTALSLNVTHRVSLPERVVNDKMFENSLVLHEMDHVRISSDPRYLEVFKSIVAKETRRIEIPITSTDKDHLDQLANDTVKARVEKIFDQVSQLAGIRYKELDKVTSHGIRPLPQDYFEMLTF